MKKVNLLILILFSQVLIAQIQRLKVGNNPTTSNSSAALEIESNSKGLLPSRMTNAQMIAIPSPAEGLVVYCNDCTPKGLYVYDGGVWSPLVLQEPTVVANCDANGFTGTFIKDISSTRSFTVTITNNSSYITTLAFENSDLVLSGVAGLSVTATSPTTATLNAGQSQQITYTITGTPTAQGTLTGVWTKLSLTCTKTRNVTLGDANFSLPQTQSVVSVYNEAPLIDIDGYIANTAPNQIVFSVPYTNGQGTYAPYTSSFITGTTGQNGDVNSFRVSYSGGIFATSGNILVTVSVDGDKSYSVKQLSLGAQEIIATLPFIFNGENKGDLLLRAIGGIPDRAFEQTIYGANNHNFIYLPIMTADGRTWLSNNLGAHYANRDHPSFNPGQQATSGTDHLAYGSLFQWGRRADGHELITYTGATTGTAVNGITFTRSATNTPINALFITLYTYEKDWRTLPNDSLWQGVTGINNPCPLEYRLPTTAEFDYLFSKLSIINSTTATNSVMRFTNAGSRGYKDDSVPDTFRGVLEGLSTGGQYWTSGVSDSNASFRGFYSWGLSTRNSSSTANRAWGISVRCIKN